jgi:hypothetical protein
LIPFTGDGRGGGDCCNREQRQHGDWAHEHARLRVATIIEQPWPAGGANSASVIDPAFFQTLELLDFIRHGIRQHVKARRARAGFSGYFTQPFRGFA